MYKFIMAFLFCLTSSIANASDIIETQKPIICAPVGKLLEALKEMDEEPVWSGRSQHNDSWYVLLFNEKTKTFTIVQLDEKMGCVLGVGMGGKMIFKGI